MERSDPHEKDFFILLSLVLALTGFAALCVTANAYNVGDTIEFGSYPQTDVTNELGSVLEQQGGEWISYNYYENSSYSYQDGEMKPSDYMRFRDVDYNGAKYRGVVFDHYRPFVQKTALDIQKQNGYNPGKTYWFRYDPIQWRVLDPSTGLVISETVLDSHEFILV